MHVPVFDVATVVRSFGLEDAFLEDGYSPDAAQTAKVASVFKEWVKENLPQHCRLS